MSPSLPRYIARRLLQSIPLILGILIFSFVLIQLAPGDPIMLLAGEGGDADYYATMRAYYGLDRPLPEQLLRYVGAILRGDFGYSFNYRQPVFDVILGRLPATLLLMGSALIFALTVGVGLGIISALRPRSLLDRSISVMTLTFTALPVFWLGQLLLMLFAARLRLFPVHGMVSVRADYTGLRHLLDLLHHLVLPTIALGLLQLALLTRLTRTSLREQLAEDYVRSARAKGLQERIVVLRHAMRNAMLPVITIIGSHVGTLITGAGERPGVRAIRGIPRV